MGKWIVVLIATLSVLGVMYWYIPGMSATAFHTPAMAGHTPLPVFGISWLLLAGVGLAIVFKRLAAK